MASSTADGKLAQEAFGGVRQNKEKAPLTAATMIPYLAPVTESEDGALM